MRRSARPPFSDWLDQLVSCGFVSQRHPMALLHDLRSIRHLQRGVREAWLERAKRPDEPFRNAVRHIATGFGPLGRVTANTIALAMQLTNSQSLHFIDDPAEVLRDLGVSPPAEHLYREMLAGGSGVAV